MEQTAQQHQQLRDAAEAARPTMAKLREEREQLVRRLRDVDQSMNLLQGVIEAWDRIERSNDPLVAQLQRIDQELRALDSTRPGGRSGYNGVERRTSPRPPVVSPPLQPITSDAGPVTLPPRAVVLERARRMLQAGREGARNAG
jgi:hypothetical protein